MQRHNPPDRAGIEFTAVDITENPMSQETYGFWRIPAGARRDGAIAERLGLKHGGRVVVRPYGYIGAITTLDDTKAVSNYFARLAR